MTPYRVSSKECDIHQKWVDLEQVTLEQFCFFKKTFKKILFLFREKVPRFLRYFNEIWYRGILCKT